MSEVITEGEVAVLNAARSILKSLETRALHATHDLAGFQAGQRGVFAEACDNAGGAIFNALNCAQHGCDAGLTEAQLHNRTGG